MLARNPILSKIASTLWVFGAAGLLFGAKGAVALPGADSTPPGRKSHAEANPSAVALARKLHRKPSHTDKRMSYRDISATMAAQGHLAASGKAYGPSAVKSMLGV